MYVKISNGTVEQYPYTLGDLRRDNPNTSFPKNMPSEALQEWGMYKVVVQATPSYDEATQNVVVADQPTLVNGTWTRVVTIEDKSADELNALNAIAEDSARAIRDSLLTETDWWALPDSPTMTAEQTTYRQALRDITTHANWPHLEEADWPTKP